MIRVLVMIAVAGFLLSVVTLSTAVAVGGPDAIARGAWSWNNGWDWDNHRGHRMHRRHWEAASGPVQTRTFAWDGGERLEIDVNADVTYTQAPGPAKLTITGPSGALDQIRVHDGVIDTDDMFGDVGRLTVVLSAPDVRAFEVNGNGDLAIENYKQDSLALDISGNSRVKARGAARSLDLDMSGSASADLGGLETDGAKVEISGSGEATVAPRDWADLDISGSGEITLLTNPKKLQSDISGSGTIRQRGEVSESPAPPATPKTKT